jgi:Zn finger protein HypA/HybF involved in hydrogenase expression
MIAEIGTGFSSLKAALDLAKGLSATSTEAAVNDVKIGLQRSILEAYEALTTARNAEADSAERIRQLEQEIMQFKDWEREKQRYVMKRFNPGTIAYVLQSGMADGEPPHCLCAQCYTEGKKGHLQATGTVIGGRHVHVCSRCTRETVMGAETDAPEAPPPPIKADYDPLAWKGGR